ncbi:MAG: mechanosensitive ion channel domain-containing protein [Steroidobacteraceae bacterium]
MSDASAASADYGGLLARMASPEILAELLAILAVVGGAYFAGHLVRSWLRRDGSAAALPPWQQPVVEGSAILAPLVTALVLLLGVRGVAGLLHADHTLPDIALQLATALVLVRLAVYLLRLLMGPDSWIRNWENRLTLLLWLLIGFQLVGWFDAMQRTLDSLDLLPGPARFSLWALLKGLIVVTAFVIATTIAGRAIERRVMTLTGLAMSTRIGISKFTYFFLVGLGILLGVNAAGVDLTALTVLTGAIGLGLGFGLQAIASNFVSGFVLLMDKSIKPGDVISFTGHTGTSTENFGWVQELRGRYVVVRDRDGVETLVPNQNLITSSVINWSYSDQRVRLKLPVNISYADDPELALEVLLEAARDHPRILKDPGPVTRLMAFEDYGMRLEVRFWISDPMNGVNNVRSDVNRTIWRLFKKHGIKMPVAQREIRIVADAAAHALPGPSGQAPPGAR